ncbi:MAG: DNA-binding response regulator [Bdellovibrio sp. CG12_big_fil_rev_8_21_14_0_65_39_13]|nr:MAG: DNA-binding response regulator [Bdellovibrio sp. CG22_combo_CG10-13_8_21_14_all_39_27]PIQ61188.1 MAG: DNA-binding response regulator [Bdellovibrio sp. CG12_big_fil_rev_8_21_14_0_65_39_13]PIR34858.1 MAG: DNA-binding response regulator [Bdellovibrio sp. CG11_big_fil_rev_8_21_14_0_20_39_38]
MSKKIFLVEDELDIAEMMKLQLEMEGHQVSVFSDGAIALDLIQKMTEAELPHLFILDRMLPQTSGLEICKFLRMYAKTKSSPILMVTAMIKPEQIVEGLDAGADDYITKPFDMNIFLARVRSLLRRSEHIKTTSTPSSSAVFNVNSLKVDTDQCKAWIEDVELELTLSEYKLLVAFLQQPGKVLTRNQLVEFIQDGPVHVTDRTIDTHVFGLRKKLGEYSKLIETIRGVGYRVSPHGN